MVMLWIHNFNTKEFYIGIRPWSFSYNSLVKIVPLQGRIQDFFIGGSNLQRGLDLLILPDYLLYFPDFS